MAAKLSGRPVFRTPPCALGSAGYRMAPSRVYLGAVREPAPIIERDLLMAYLKRIAPLVVLALAALSGCGQDPADPIDQDPPPPQEGHTFTYLPPDGAPHISSISVRGSFSGWNQVDMTEATDGSYRATIDLDDGTHTYKFYINDAWVNDMCYDETWGDPAEGYVVDPDADGCVSDGYAGQNAVITLGEVTLDFVHNRSDPAQVSVAGDRLSVRFRARAGEVDAARVVTGSDTLAMHRQLEVGLDEVWRVSLPETVTSYAFLVDTPDSTAELGPYDVPANLFRSVTWVQDAVGYQIFPERFWNGDPTNDSAAVQTDEYHYSDVSSTVPVLTESWSGPVDPTHCCHQYFGGDLQGIIDRLDYLEGMGATAVYLNPIFLAGSAHGYDTFDYFEVAPNFGDSTVLRALVDQAHARGIRLIWDYVPNHVGIGHWAFQDAVQNGESSAYWDWFEFHVDADSIEVGNGNHYEAWWGFGSLPELQTQNAEVTDHLLSVVEHWTTFGLDGIRVDVPNEIENRSSFFPAFRQTAKGIDPETYLVGEIWERDPTWLRGDQFDALMNYAIGEQVVEQFARGDIPGHVADARMATLYAEYPEAATAMLFNLVASHDTDRLLTKLGGGELGETPSTESLTRQRLAAALLFAVPGMPVTWQGDECAFLGGRDGYHTARYPVQWSDCDAAMQAHYTELAGLKQSLPALGSSVIRSYEADNAVLSFYRGEPGPGEVLAVFNNQSAQASLTLPDGSWTDAVTGESVSGSATVDGLGWRYLVRS